MSATDEAFDWPAWHLEPVPFQLTLKGWAASGQLLTSEEAAALLGTVPATVAAYLHDGTLVGTMVDGRWLLERDQVMRLLKAPAPRRRRLPAGPLLRLVDGRGGPAACGIRQGSADERALDRARRTGRITEDAADRLAVRLLGLVPAEIWAETGPESG